MMTTDPRVEAAAKAIDKELADSATGPLYIAHLEFFPERAAREALAAADEADPVRKAAHELAHFIEEGMGVYDDTYDDPAATSMATVTWQDITRLGDLRDALAAALAAAGAQPPPKEDDHG